MGKFRKPSFNFGKLKFGGKHIFITLLVVVTVGAIVWKMFFGRREGFEMVDTSGNNMASENYKQGLCRNITISTPQNPNDPAHDNENCEAWTTQNNIMIQKYKSHNQSWNCDEPIYCKRAKATKAGAEKAGAAVLRATKGIF